MEFFYKISTDTTAMVTCQGRYYGEYSNEYTGSVTIPSTITYNDTTYTITEIDNITFYDCTGLTSVTIPNSVTTINFGAFCYCTDLTTIKSLNNTPPNCASFAFSECDNAILEVPAGPKEAYEAAMKWSNFTNIIEFATVEVSTQGNNAIFDIPSTEGAVSCTVNVYSDEAMTQLVATTNYDATGNIIPMATSLELSIDELNNGIYYFDVVRNQKQEKH